MECQYCNKNFTVKSSLIHHQKTAKFCIKKQNILVSDTYKCNYCSKILSTQSRLQTHIKICKTRLQDEKNKEDEKLAKQLKDLEDKFQSEIKDHENKFIKLNEQLKKQEIELKEKEIQFQSQLKDQEIQIQAQLKEQEINLRYISKIEKDLAKANQTIADIAMQPKTMNNTDNRVNNNHITNNFDINNIDTMTRMLESHLTPDVMRRGQEGVADMLKTHLLQTATGDPMYECTDVSRQKFEFRNADGNMETDPKATKLIRNLGRSGMWNKACSSGKKLWEKADGTVNVDAMGVFMPNVTEVLEIDKDSSKLRRRLASITARQRAPVVSV
jgi:hypothetical protein